MGEMKYPVLRGWIPAQVKLSLTGPNTGVSVLDEVEGDNEHSLSFSLLMAFPSLYSLIMVTL